MPTIEIQALDTLFFRDGKPFEMGDDNWADGTFPPPPSVIYGALRSAYFAQHPELMGKWNTDDPTKKLRITGIYLKYDNRIYLPTPLDIVIDKNYDDEHLFPLKLINSQKNKIIHNSEVNFIPVFDGEAFSPKGYYLRDGDFKRYLQNKIDKDNGIISTNIEKLILKEPKIGIGLDHESGTTSEGKLYRVGLNRLRENFDKEWLEFIKLSFIVEFEGIELNQQGILKLGAENKTVVYSKFNDNIEHLKEIHTNNNKYNLFKIILLTPAITEKGNLLKLNADKEIITGFVDNYIAIGGWDIKEKKPKTLYRAIPAGSVFYIRTKNKLSISDLYYELGFSLSEKRKNEGFGLYLITNLNL